jgi:hypothetical protein
MMIGTLRNCHLCRSGELVSIGHADTVGDSLEIVAWLTL